MKTTASSPALSRGISLLVIAHLLFYAFAAFAWAGIEFPVATATAAGLVLLFCHDYAPRRSLPSQPPRLARRLATSRFFASRSPLPVR